jgi:4-hydroxy-4-methyl-2-oxoglutarate aldolase
VDGSIRDLEGIAPMPMPAYFRHAHPTPIGNVMLSGVNIPVRIGDVIVMPGDLVVGDREGVYFIPPAQVNNVLDNADITHIHDEWTARNSMRANRNRARFTARPKIRN